jgi:hypothetical protein
MSANAAALTLIAGAALLAAWVDVRFPRIAPGSFIAVGIHMVCAIFAVQIGMRILGLAPPQPPEVMAALFGAALPATMYLLLSAFWLLKLLHGLIGGTSRPNGLR